MKTPKIISMGTLGHSPTRREAFGPNYKESDIGSNADLTVELLGFELGIPQVNILLKELRIYKINVNTHYKRRIK